MRRADDVFFFTLIDFLVQVFFFGLLLYAFSQAARHQEQTKAASDAQEREKVLSAAGVSDLVELTDLLTRLAPVDQLVGMSEYIQKAGGLDNVKKAVAAADAAGGPEALGAKIEKLQRFEEGSGKRACVSDSVNGKNVPRRIAVLRADDTTIRIEKTTPDFENILRDLGRDFASVSTLTLGEFRMVFREVIRRQPDCRYTVTLIEDTRLVDARDAVDSAFYFVRVKP